MAKTIQNRPNPLYAVAGAADIAVSALRELPNRLPTLAERAESAATGARSRLNDLSAELPAELRKLRDELPERLHDAQARAEHYYTELAGRGETAVARIREGHDGTETEPRQPEQPPAVATEAPVAESVPTEPSPAQPGPAGKATTAKETSTRKSPSTGRSAAKKTSNTKARSTANKTGKQPPMGADGDQPNT